MYLSCVAIFSSYLACASASVFAASAWSLYASVRFSVSACVLISVFFDSISSSIFALRSSTCSPFSS